jgi:glycosyltransferase involved in cell wall biosynthesis
MKISLINNSASGYGADNTMMYYYKEAENRGYEVEFNKIDESIDFYVIGMFYEKTEEELKKYLKPGNYIYIEHSIECLLPEKEWIREWLIPNAYKTLFFSPRHRLHIQDCLPSTHKHLAIDNYDLIVVPVDYNFFRPQDGIVRDEHLYIFVGLIHSNKGVLDLLSIAKTNYINNYIFMGTMDGGDIDPKIFDKYENCRYIGHQKPEVLLQYYSKASGCYLIPANGAVESAGRVVLEAILCGCKPQINGNVGNASYDWFYSYDRQVVIRKMNESLDRFFEILNQGVKEYTYGKK